MSYVGAKRLMFITHEIDAGEMLAEHLKGRRVTPTATAAFVDLRHDRDLCPHFANQVNTILGVYRAYGQKVHDIQSFRDDGVDVLLVYEDKDGQERKIGLQIKSEEEFRQWEAKKLPLIQILKGQAAQAVANVRLDAFYIVLCVDAVRHQKRIRNVCSELKNFSRCEIIEPIDALGFYQTKPMDLWARTTRMLCNRDVILGRAKSEADARAPDVAFFTIALLCQAFEGSLRVDDARLFDIWNDWEEFAGTVAGDQNRLSDILWELNGDGVLGGEVGDDYTIQVNRLPHALSALYFDLKVRASDHFSNLTDHMISLVELMERMVDDEDIEEDDGDAT
jgi:hypothetical protein